MKKREYAEAVERCIPQTPPVFHQAMSRTLEAIAAQAPAQERAAKVRPALPTRRALAFALAALLLIATAAVAATQVAALTGAATVILAMGAGKTAAASIDEYIQNKAK